MRKVAIDAGCAYIKVVAFDNQNRVIQHAIPSILVEGEPTIDLEGNTSPTYRCEGAIWTAIESAHNPYNTRTDEYPYEPVNTVLMHHALAMVGISNDEIQVATSIPLNDYYKRDMKANKARKVKTVSLPVQSFDYTPLATMEAKIVVPEGLAGWIDMCYDYAGQQLPGVPVGQVGLVDIGGRTTDICVVEGLNVYGDTVETVRRGYLDVFDDINQMINNKYPDTKKFPVNTLDKALKTKQLEIETGKIIDISDEVQLALNTFTNGIMRDVNRQLGGDRQLAGTCFFGGGVEHIKDVIKERPLTFIPEDPQFANARGAMKAYRL